MSPIHATTDSSGRRVRSRPAFVTVTALAALAAVHHAPLAAHAAADAPAPARSPFAARTMAFDLGFFGVSDQAWWPEMMVLRDFDGDGDLDVATANRGNFLLTAPRVSVAMNAGDGTFGAPVAYITPAASRAIAAGDVDGDGDEDLVVSDAGEHFFGTTVTVLRNAGDGTFAVDGTFETGGEGVTGIAVADFDGDRRLDLAVTHHGRLSNGDTIGVLLGRGDATFDPPQVHGVGDGPYRIEAGDLDGDGAPDLVVTCDKNPFGETGTHRLMNDGTGGFAASIPLPVIVHGGSPYPCIDLCDMDGDGDLDVVYGDLALSVSEQQGSTSAVAIHRNDGTGAFGPADRYPLGLFTGGFSSVRAGDLNGDGWPEVIGTHDANEAWGLLYGTPGGGLGDYVHLPAGEYPRDCAIADVDGDGDLDPMVMSHFSQTLTVHYNDGQMTAGAERHVELIGGSYHFDAADADGDGDVDLVASSGYAADGAISFYRNLGGGTFDPFPIVYASPTYSIGVKLRDLDGDGLNDLLWADKYPPYSYRSRLNQGGGQFGPWRSHLDVQTCGVTICDAVDAFDFDGDGDLDSVLVEHLACAGGGNSGERIFVSRNDGAGNFTLVNIVQCMWGPYTVLADDVNHDGHLDLIAVSRTIEVALGHGDLTFDDPVVYGGTVGATRGTLADVNGDGETDVLVVIPNQGTVEPSLGVLLGSADGSFAGPFLHRGTSSPNLAQYTALAASDVDGDGDVDALLAGYAANDVTVFLNDGTGDFAMPFHVAAIENLRDIAVADLDGDGTGDLLAMGSFPEYGELGVSGIAIVDGRPAETGPAGDLDGDGVVGLSDVLVVLASWGGCPANGACPADLDGDGTVGLSDLLVVLTDWS